MEGVGGEAGGGVGGEGREGMTFTECHAAIGEIVGGLDDAAYCLEVRLWSMPRNTTPSKIEWQAWIAGIQSHVRADSPEELVAAVRVELAFWGTEKATGVKEVIL